MGSALMGIRYIAIVPQHGRNKRSLQPVSAYKDNPRMTPRRVEGEDIWIDDLNEDRKIYMARSVPKVERQTTNAPQGEVRFHVSAPELESLIKIGWRLFK